jgi:rfaE bifunctional protein kinase chain/domain
VNVESAKIREAVEKFDGLSVGLLGDVSADVWTFATPKTGPRPGAAMILAQEDAEVRAGRAGAVATAMAALGARVRLVGVVGQDAPGQMLVNALQQAKVDTDGLIPSDEYLTPTRTLILAGPFARAKRLVARVDQEMMTGLPSGLSGQVLAKVRETAGDVAGWLFSDHGYGIAAPGVASMLEGTRIAESRTRIDGFSSMTALVVSATEAERVTGHDVRDDGQSRRAATEILEATSAAHLLLTRGALGMTLYAADGREGRLPPVTQLEAADAAGAGDAAAAAFTLGLCAGATVEDAAAIANLVAGFTIGRPGTVPVGRNEVLSVLGE